MSFYCDKEFFIKGGGFKRSPWRQFLCLNAATMQKMTLIIENTRSILNCGTYLLFFLRELKFCRLSNVGVIPTWRALKGLEKNGDCCVMGLFLLNQD